MSTVTEIKEAILNFPQDEYAQIIEWLYELEELEWDRQIEADSSAGRLDSLRAEAEGAKANGVLVDL